MLKLWLITALSYKIARPIKRIVLPIIDLFLSPIVYISSLSLRFIRAIGIADFPICKNALLRCGVFPIINHYYEPLFDYRNIVNLKDYKNSLDYINFNLDGQLSILAELKFAEELLSISDKPNYQSPTFYWGNEAFEAGDAEFWYQIIRLKKPKRIIEVGSGYSTLLARMAIDKNIEDDKEYQCEHTCIEPFENKWLEKTGVKIVRKKVEDIGISFFDKLNSGDILFIDSSHIIRPSGDVLFEYLELMSTLNSGVIVHIHDIFLPNHYPITWLKDSVRFWNEQYLLTAFLIGNNNFKVTAALNYLHHNYYEQLKSVCPNLTSKHEPGSFYLEKL